MTTISANSSGVTLASPAYANPVVINPGVTIAGSGNGVSALSGSWTIDNQGTVGAPSGIGIYLAAGGSITNAGTGAISGIDAIYGEGAALTVVNSGSIAGNTASGFGIELLSGGLVSNGTSASVIGYKGVYGGSGATLTVTNQGTIAGYAGASFGVGVELAGGGSVTNQASASIGGYDGIYGASFGATTVVNTGSITGNATAGTGIKILGGGSITNTSSAAISGNTGIFGGFSGPLTAGDALTVVNGGSIAGNATGIFLFTTGSVTNQSTGAISGDVGVNAFYAITVVNDGQILGYASNFGGWGIELEAGGSVTNGSNATISGYDGVYGGTGGSATVVNRGTIAGNGTAGIGVDLQAGGYVTNLASAVISGNLGIAISGWAGTVVNAGSIAGYGGIAVSLAPNYANRVVLYPGASFSGTVNGGNVLGGGGVVAGLTGTGGAVLGSGVASTLELAQGTTAGVFSSLNSKYVNFAQVTVDAGATWTFSSGQTLANHQTLTNSGLIDGTVTVGSGAYLDNRGTIDPAILPPAVVIAGNAVVFNAAGALISGGGIGITGGGGVNTVVNAGSIVGNNGADAVFLAPGYANLLELEPTGSFSGKVDGGNAPGALAVSTLDLTSGASAGTLSGLGGSIVDFGQVFVDSGARWTLSGATTIQAGAYLNNSGTLSVDTSSAQNGITLAAGASLINQDGATVANPSGTAVYGGGAAATVFNAGSISGAGTSETAPNWGSAIQLAAGGYVYDEVSGRIGSAQRQGIVIQGGAGTVVNAGLIAAYGGGDAVSLAAGFDNRLVLVPGGSFSGTVDGGNLPGAGTASTLELAAGASPATLSGLGTSIVDFTDIVIDTGATWTLSPVPAGYTVTDFGTLDGSLTLGANAYFHNVSGATIVGSGQAAIRAGAGGTIINAGLIDPANYGVYLQGGGSFTNASSGSVIGTVAGVMVTGAAGTIVNAGGIYGISAGSSGIALDAGGSVNNQAGGTIDGTLYGIDSSASATVTNSGRIGITASIGIGLSSGMVTNAGTASIAGANSGVRIFNGGTVVNAGGISGGGDAVHLYAGSTNRLVIDPGAVFSGLVDGGNTVGAAATSTLELASGSTTGTLTGLGATYVNFGQITLDTGASWTLDGANTLGAGVTLAGSGTLRVNGSLGLVSGTPGTIGLVDINAGLLIVGSGAGTNGMLTVGSYDTIDLSGTGASIGGAQTASALVLGNAGPSGLLGGAQGTVAVSGTGASLDSTGPIAIGRSAGASGLLSVSNGGSAVAESGASSSAAIAIGQFGSGALVVSGADLTADGLVYDGRAGTGSVLIENQGSVVQAADLSGDSDQFQVGVGNGNTLAQTGGSGTATITSGGILNGGSQATFQVGGNGDQGTLTVNSGTVAGSSTVLGGTVEAGFIVLGLSATIASATTLSGTVTTTRTLLPGAGILNIDSGALVETLGTTTPAFTVVDGRDAGSSGTVTVGGTLLTNGQIVVGNNGSVVLDGTVAVSGGNTIVSNATTIAGASGTLSVQSGGFVSAGDGLVIANGAGATGAVSVDGGTLSAIPPNGGTFVALIVGSSGSGSLLIDDAGTVTATQSPGPALDIGINAGAQGSAAVNGSGALLQVNGQLIVGDQGTGTLSVNGGMVSGSGIVSIGNRSGGAGDVTIYGGGTLSGGAFSIASPGVGTATGTLSVSSGTVDATSLTEGGGGVITVSDGLLTASGSTGGIAIGNTGTGAILTIDAGGTVSETGTLNIMGTAGPPPSPGTVDVVSIGAGSTVSGTVIVAGGLLSAADGVQVSNGTLAVSGGGVVQGGSASSLEIGSFGNGSGSGTVTVNSGTVDGFGAFNVAGGLMTVGAGGEVTVSSTGTLLFSGVNPTGSVNGTLVVNGGTVSATNAGFEVGGSNVSGSLLVEGGGLLTTSTIASQFAQISIDGTGTGAAVATVNGGTWDVNGPLAIAPQADSNGWLDISNNGVVNAGTNAISVATVSGASGTISVEAGGTLLGGTLALANPLTGSVSGTLEIGSGGTVDVTAASISAGGSVLLDGGLLDPASMTLGTGGIASGYGTLDANIDNLGSILAAGGTLEVTGTVSGSGTMDIAANAALVLQGTVMPGQVVGFNAATGVLQVGTTGFEGVIGNNLVGDFQSGDSIVLTGLTDATAANLLGGNTLQIVSASLGNIDLQLDPEQGFLGDYFHVSTVGGNALVIENAVPCYLAGTMILTDRGEVQVEALGIGDRVVTRDGTARPIKWIGRRSYAGAIPTGLRDVIPVLIRQGALGENLPKRDLVVSPLHAMYCDGVLVPAEHLVNGISILRAPDIDPIRYFHIELDRHDVIYAEGAPAETFVDCDSRAMFHNAPEFDELYPGDAAPRWRFCAPRVEDGARLDAIKRTIDRRAGIALPEPGAAPGRLEGRLDGVEGNRISGWARHPEQPATPVWLEVLDGDGVIARVHARRYRADLEAAGLGDGRYGFELHLTGQMRTREEIRVRRVEDGVELDGSPLVIEAHGGEALLEDARRVIAAAILDPSDDAALDALATELLHGVDALRRARAALDARGRQRLQAIGPRSDAAAGPEPGARTTAAEGMGHAGAAPARNRRRALIIDAQLPRPERDAGSQAVLSHAAALTALGFQVEFVAAHELARAEQAAVALESAGYVVHRVPRVASVEEVLRRHRNAFDLVYLHRVANAEAYAALARTWQARARLLYCVADLHHVRLARQAAVQASAELADAARAMRVRELNAMRLCDAVITHSTVEAAYLARVAPAASVHVVPWAPSVRPRPVPLAARRGVAAIGSWSHEPNIDAVRWLVSDIMPRVWAAAPGIELLVVGSGWPVRVPWITDRRVRLVGPVTSIETLLGMLRLTVAPLRFGAGLKGKVLDSFAGEVPCVMTGVAAEGFPLEGSLPGLVGDDAAPLASLIVRLHQETPFHRAAAADGLALAAKFSLAAVREAMAAAVGTAARAARPDVAAAGGMARSASVGAAAAAARPDATAAVGQT